MDSATGMPRANTRAVVGMLALVALVVALGLLLVPSSTSEEVDCGSVVAPALTVDYYTGDGDEAKGCSGARGIRATIGIPLFVGSLVALWRLWWTGLSPARQAHLHLQWQASADRKQRKAEAKGTYRKQLSVAGIKSPMGLQCPRCHGTQFSTRESWRGRAKGRRVVCVTCGAKFKRG